MCEILKTPHWGLPRNAPTFFFYSGSLNSFLSDMLHLALPFSFEFTYSLFFYIFFLRTSFLLNSTTSSFILAFFVWKQLKILFRTGLSFDYLFNSFPHTVDFNHKDIQEII